MSTRNYDHCICGHNRGNHYEFDGECEKCHCGTFQRKIRIKNIAIN